MVLSLLGCQQIAATLSEDETQVVATAPADAGAVLWSTVYPGFFDHRVDPQADFIREWPIRSASAIETLEGELFFSSFQEKVNAVLIHPLFDDFENTGSISGFRCANPAVDPTDPRATDDGNLSTDGDQPLSFEQDEFCVLYEQADWLEEYKDGVQELREPFTMRPDDWISGDWVASRALPESDQCYRIWAIVDSVYADGTPENFERFNDMALYLAILDDPNTASVSAPSCENDGGEAGGGSGLTETQSLGPAQLAATGADESALAAMAVFGTLAVFVGAMLVASGRRAS